ncbi:hypothetical protein Cal6303_4690 [Calothrix sp. PCC 6303]|nr:hypothetical protein Cal6303_4690 [Calothrix sp. PCC 6303]
MTSSLQLLFAAIQKMQNEQDMRSHVIPKAGEYFTENYVKQALKRMFRKLEVSSRVELVMQLRASPDIKSESY